jgi:pyruvate/2-oxoglutarate dehydrogenase complex dihydrolipoamide dehydrogenase (E3) component
MKTSFDIIVIGGGSAGLYAAGAARGQGARVCLVEKNKLGGECTWTGCVPSKALIKSAETAHRIRSAAAYGVTLSGSCSIDTTGVLEHVRSVVNALYVKEDPAAMEKKGIRVVQGCPKFVDRSSIAVNGEQLSANRFILCTGSRPFVPPVPGLREIDYLTNETIFERRTLPKSLIVLGGGPIGMELSQALHRLGVAVTVVEMADRILAHEDAAMAQLLHDRLSAEGIAILTGYKAIAFSSASGTVTAMLEDNAKNTRTLHAESVLVAVGRSANTEGLDLEKAGITFTKKGVSVNEHLQTSNERVFSCGDVVGPYQFTHVAAYQAYICVRNALFKRLAWEKARYDNIVWATFTQPELAHLGLTEEEARARHGRVKVYSAPYTESDRAYTDVETEGFVKLITDEKDRILGAHILGALASEIMQGFIVAKSQKLPVTKIARALYIYPTLSELAKRVAAQPLLEKIQEPLVSTVVNLMKTV